MREKILLGFVIAGLLIVSMFFVAAVITRSSNQEVNVEKLALGLSVTEVADEDDDIDEKEDEQEEVPITGSALEKASAVALAHIGEGRVTDTETGDEDGYYEIEITLDNGREVDVHLDEHFTVISVEKD